MFMNQSALNPALFLFLFLVYQHYCGNGGDVESSLTTFSDVDKQERR